VSKSSLSAEFRAEAVAFGQRIRQLRDAKGWTQEDLAEHANIHRNQVQNVERGTLTGRDPAVTNPQLSTYLGLCRALGISIRIDVNSPSGFVIQIED